MLDPARESVQRHRAGQAPARHADADAGAARTASRSSSFAVQGGDAQDQNLLQFFLNVVEFGMTPQEAAEAANFNSYQMRELVRRARDRSRAASLLSERRRRGCATSCERMGYTPTFAERSSGPINAILFDREHGTMWGGSSNHGEDYGIAW